MNFLSAFSLFGFLVIVFSSCKKDDIPMTEMDPKSTYNQSLEAEVNQEWSESDTNQQWSESETNQQWSEPETKHQSLETQTNYQLMETETSCQVIETETTYQSTEAQTNQVWAEAEINRPPEVFVGGEMFERFQLSTFNFQPKKNHPLVFLELRRLSLFFLYRKLDLLFNLHS